MLYNNTLRFLVLSVALLLSAVNSASIDGQPEVIQKDEPVPDAAAAAFPQEDAPVLATIANGTADVNINKNDTELLENNEEADNNNNENNNETMEKEGEKAADEPNNVEVTTDEPADAASDDKSDDSTPDSSTSTVLSAALVMAVSLALAQNQ